MTLIDAGIPTSAQAAGLAARFRYWQGNSGRRYLFSVVNPKRVRDFEGGIVMLTREKNDFREVIWLGVLIGKRPTKKSGGISFTEALSLADEAYIHLLSKGRMDQTSILSDLVEAAAA